MDLDCHLQMPATTLITRRQLLHNSVVAMGAVLLSQHVIDCSKIFAQEKSQEQVATRFLKGDALYKDVVTYSELGEHRTATSEDIKTSEWLAGELGKAGLKTEFHPFSVRQFFLENVSLQVDGRSFGAFPLWPPHATGPTPIQAPLVQADTEPAAGRQAVSLRGSIALGHFGLPSVRLQPERLIAKLVAAGVIAVVAIYETVSGDLFAHNLHYPLPFPVVVAGTKDEPALNHAAKRGAQATLRVEGREDADAQARNVVGRLERGKRQIVISTPYSAWFKAGGERGPGVALFLALARWAAKRPTENSYLFVASSGHELGGAGIKSFVGKHAPPPDQVICWLHLGASISTYDWEKTPQGMRKLDRVFSKRRFLATNKQSLVPILARAFQPLPDWRPILTERAAGELMLLFQSGYRAFGLSGAHPHFHSPNDGPEATGPELLEPVGQALTKALIAVEAGG